MYVCISAIHTNHNATEQISKRTNVGLHIFIHFCQQDLQSQGLILASQLNHR